MKVTEFRQKYPQYDGLSDETLVSRFHKKYYPDMDYGEFSYKVGHVPVAEQPALKEALTPPTQGYAGLRGVSTIAPTQPQQKTPLESEFREAEEAPVSPYSQSLSRGGKNIQNAFLDTLKMLPESDDQATYEYMKRRHPETAEKYNPKNKKDLETFKAPLDPVYNPGQGFTKYAHDFVEMIPQIATQIGTTVAAGPVAGGGFMATQIAGPQYDSLVKQGVPKDRARIAAMLNATGQGFLEQVGIAKALKAKGAGGVLGAMFTEWLTETMQKNPELATTIWATTEGKSNKERYEMFVEKWWDATKEGMYEGAVAAPFGGLAGGVNVAADRFQHDDLGTARVTPDKSLEVPSEVKPVVIGTPEQISEIEVPEGKEVYQVGQKSYIMDVEAVHNQIGEDTPNKSLRKAKRMLQAGDDSQLLGKPSREGVPQEELETAAVTREGEVLTEPDQIKQETEAGNVIEAAEGRKEDVKKQAQIIGQAVKGQKQKGITGLADLPKADATKIRKILNTYSDYKVGFGGKAESGYQFKPRGKAHSGMDFGFKEIPTVQEFGAEFRKMAKKHGKPEPLTKKQLRTPVQVPMLLNNKKVVAEMSAKKALADVDQRRSLYNKLMDCLTS